MGRHGVKHYRCNCGTSKGWSDGRPPVVCCQQCATWVELTAGVPPDLQALVAKLRDALPPDLTLMVSVSKR